MNAVSLLVAPAWVGDAVMSEPLIRHIAAHDQKPVDVLAPPWVAPVFERMPGIGRIIPAPFAHGKLDLGARWQLGRQLSDHGYRSAYVLPNSLKSALAVAFAGIPNRIGFTGECRYGFLNHRQRLDKQALPRMVDRFLALGPKTGGTVTADTTPHLRAAPGAFEGLCHRLGLVRNERLAVLCPGAEYGPAKRWPAYKYAKLVDEVGARIDCQWVVLGTKADKPLAAEIARGNSNVTDLAGKTTLEELIELLSRLTGLVTNDTGTMHLADYVGTPLVAIFGSTEPDLTGPRGARSTVIRHKVECSPCFLRECPIDFRCMLELPMERVVDAVLKLLK